MSHARTREGIFDPPPPKPDFGVVTPDGGHWAGRYFIWDLRVNDNRKARLDDERF